MLLPSLIDSIIGGAEVVLEKRTQLHGRNLQLGRGLTSGQAGEWAS